MESNAYVPGQAGTAGLENRKSRFVSWLEKGEKKNKRVRLLWADLHRVCDTRSVAGDADPVISQELGSGAQHLCCSAYSKFSLNIMAALIERTNYFHKLHSF